MTWAFRETLPSVVGDVQIMSGWMIVVDVAKTNSLKHKQETSKATI